MKRLLEWLFGKKDIPAANPPARGGTEGSAPGFSDQAMTSPDPFSPLYATPLFPANGNVETGGSAEEGAEGETAGDSGDQGGGDPGGGD